MLLFFFFKQKTAYEMRISDWSSDVCSSDLVSGTPTDAVMLGMRKVMDNPPDLILSGVNRGANLGDDVTYSGTVSAAIEGALAGIKSIAQIGRETCRERVCQYV